jgi:hypothetical protein
MEIMTARKWTIYGLTEPDTKEVRYVGFTFTSVKERLRRHISDSQRNAPNARNRKAGWIRAILRRQRKPGVVVLQVGTGNHCAAEKFWMSLFAATGASLVNSKTGPKRRRTL